MSHIKLMLRHTQEIDKKQKMFILNVNVTSSVLFISHSYRAS